MRIRRPCVTWPRRSKVALIDLHAASKVFYKALGPDLDKAFQDGTHHNNYGSYQLAQCIIQGIKDNKLDLARSIVDDFKGFDPARPDPVDQFHHAGHPRCPGRAAVGELRHIMIVLGVKRPARQSDS